jgi:hypothetical protein
MPKKKAKAVKPRAKKKAAGAKKTARTKKENAPKKPVALIVREPEVIPPGEEPKHPGGRPSEYSEEIANAIFERMLDGESLRSICRDEDMPGLATIFRWQSAHGEFREQYARARQMQAEILAEEIVQIADTPMIGAVRKVTPLGTTVIQADMIERAKLRVDTRKWTAARILPKRYGPLPLEKTEEKNEALQAMIDALNAGPVAPGEVNEQ